MGSPLLKVCIRKCFRLVQFLPLDNMTPLVGDDEADNQTFSTKSITDLHLIMALVEVNEASRNVIAPFTLFPIVYTLSTFSDNLPGDEDAKCTEWR